MLGVYSEFPIHVHKTVNFETSISETKLQKALIEAVFKLNNQTLTLQEVAFPSLPNCTVGFEFGIAENNDFNFLDQHEKSRLLTAIEKRPFSSLDFLCIIRYHKTQDEKRRPLKFDHYMFRFRFEKKAAQIQIFHEKGPMHISQKDLPPFLTRIINGESPKKILKTIREF
jgi:hypothetical protein